MERQIPKLDILTIWRLRLLFCAAAPAFISALLFRYIFLAGCIFTSLWGLGFLYFYILYYPIKYRKLAYAANERCLLVHCGVIYTRVKAIPFASILYLSITSTPLERFFNVYTLRVYCAGSVTHLSGLAARQVLLLRSCLMQRSGRSDI